MNRFVELKTPLDKDVLLLHKMQAKEELSRLSEYKLDLLSSKGDVDLAELLGKTLTVNLQLASNEVRHFNGYVTRIAQTGIHGRYHTYNATVRPWLWFLTRTTNCRIFQDKKVPDILKEIFDQHSAIADVKLELTETYQEWDYCVQYRESDFDFVSRLMEHEGIYYFFRHTADKHTLVLADSYSAHSPIDEKEIQYIPPGKQVRPDKEHISEWSMTRELQPGKFALTDYDFEKPSVNLQVKSNIKRDHALAEYEIYDYPGDYVERKAGEQYARTRIEELQTRYERVQGTTNARSLAPGFLFKLSSHPRADQNAEYLVLNAEYDIQSSEYEAMDKPAASFKCKFSALNSHQPFRAERSTQKPIVQGPQTAIVVGPSGEDIYTDKFGRVKVHFHWDRYGKRDENSSCWIRVSQNWGGKGWGGMFIPHVGQEVIVEFLEGDPDSPLITGRVYNAENMPPVALPGGKSQSVIRDHGGNEIIMEGGAGAQKMRLFSPTHNTVMTLGNSVNLSSDSHIKLNTLSDWLVAAVGKWDVKVGGDVLKFFAGAEHSTIVGLTSKLIGGIKHESVVGAELKRNNGAKVEIVQGATFKQDKSTTYELTAAGKKEKALSLLQQLKLARCIHDEYKHKVKADAHTEAGNECAFKATKIRNTADDVVIKAKGNLMFKSDVYDAQWESHKEKAKKYDLKADDAYFAAKSVFNDGALTVKK